MRPSRRPPASWAAPADSDLILTPLALVMMWSGDRRMALENRSKPLQLVYLTLVFAALLMIAAYLTP